MSQLSSGRAARIATLFLALGCGEKLRTTTAHLKIEYSFENRRNKKDHTVSYRSSDSAVFHMDSCQQVDIVVADRVRRN
jgi:hypothetical protein